MPGACCYQSVPSAASTRRADRTAAVALDADAVPGARPLILLSPHPDDLCYSLGGFLARRDCTGDVAVVSFTASRLTPGMAVHRGDPVTTSALRRAEDARYLAGLGAARIDLGLDDCTLRSACSRDWFNAPWPRAAGACVRAAIRSALRSSPRARVVAPLGLGGNADHLAVRDAALRTVPPADLVFYEDLPYAADVGTARIERLVEEFAPRFSPVVLPMPDGIGSKLVTAAVSYPSQFRPSDGDALTRHARGVGGAGAPAERVWILQECS